MVSINVPNFITISLIALVAFAIVGTVQRKMNAPTAEAEA